MTACQDDLLRDRIEELEGAWGCSCLGAWGYLSIFGWFIKDGYSMLGQA
jgi:hypothetical protein